MNILTTLQDPELVVKLQNFFGIHVVNVSETEYSESDFKDKVKDLPNKENLIEKFKITDDPVSVSECSKTKSRSLRSENNSTSAWSSLILGDGTVGGSEGHTDTTTLANSQSNSRKINYVINNRFWYYLFYVATKTGDEIFYIIFFPFWNWNIDGAVMREVIYIWMITMYIGQALKDILRVPRPPSPPVVRLDPKWCLEYGLPSTHAMVAFSIPFSTLILSLNRYQLNNTVCFVIAFTWCILVCTSRVYLGMHSVLDIVSGLVLVGMLLILILPLIEAFDHFMLTHPFSPLISITLSISMIVCYPSSDRWTPARGDTTVIVGVGCGCLVGYWLNYQLGIIFETSLQPPFTILWPSLGMVGISFLRTLLGLIALLIVRAVCKPFSMTTICALLQVNANDYSSDPFKIPQKQRLTVELFYKFITYMSIGFAIVFICPVMFKFLGVERPTFYTEI